jgi:hypothetical protein
MERTIELYGRLRAAGATVTIEVPDDATAGAVLALLKAKLGPGLEGCALATEDAVLRADERVPGRGRLAALPPVCGG